MKPGTYAKKELGALWFLDEDPSVNAKLISGDIDRDQYTLKCEASPFSWTTNWATLTYHWTPYEQKNSKSTIPRKN